MSTATPGQAVVQRVLDAFAAGDMESARSAISPDVTVDEAASLPFGGAYVGRDGFFGMLESLGAAYEVAVTGQELVSVADRVYLHLQMTFTARATGRSVSLSGVEVYRVSDGMITGIDVYYKDTHALVDMIEAP